MIVTRKKTLMNILTELNNIEDKQERIWETRRLCGEIPTIAKLIQYTYHPDCAVDLPEGEVPSTLYKRSSHEEQGILYKLINREEIKNCFKSANVNKLQKERLFISFLERVAHSDVDLVIGIKDKRLPQRRLTEKFMIEALPELFPNGFKGGEGNG